MAYLSRPSYLGVGAIDSADRDAALARRSSMALRYKNAYKSLIKLGPQAAAVVLAQARVALAKLPPQSAKQVSTLANALVNQYDLRSVTGLGDPVSAAAGAAETASSTAATIASIAGLVASLGTLGLGVAQFVESRKTQKTQRQVAEQQAASQAKADNLAIKQAQEQLRQVKQQSDAEAANKAGYTLLPDGTIVKKESSGGLATAGAVAAAAVSAFFITK